jgi:hypothetical protein
VERIIGIADAVDTVNAIDQVISASVCPAKKTNLMLKCSRSIIEKNE